MTDQLRGTDVAEREISCSKVMRGHQSGVYGALLLRDGTLLSYAPDEPFLIWDPLSGNCLSQIPAAEPSIAGMLQVDDEQILLWPEPPEQPDSLDDVIHGRDLPREPHKPRYPSPFEPSHIVLWNLKTQQRTPLWCECVTPLSHVELTDDGWLRAWSQDGMIWVWKMDNPDHIFHTEPLVSRLWELIRLSDDRALVRSNTHELRLSAKGDQGFDLVLRGHKAIIRFACELSDGQILSCSDDTTLRLWNSTTGICEKVLKGHQDFVIAACELPDGQLLSWSADETFRVWNIASGRCVKVIHDKRAAQTWRGIRLACWKILLWSQMTESWIFNPVTLEIESVLAGHEATIRGFVQLKNGNVVSFSDDRTLRLWNTGVIGGELAVGSCSRQSKFSFADTASAFADTATADRTADKTANREEGEREEGEVNMGTLLSYDQRCKNFSRPRRTSGHDRQQQHERSTVMSEEKKSDEEAAAAAQECFMDYLAEEGFRPEIDKDGDVHFKAEGRHYYIVSRASDPQFVQLIHPHFWSIESEEERQKVVVAANQATGRCKCCKVYTSDDNTSAAVEMFVAEPSHAVAVLQRSLGALQNGVNKFVEEMRKETL